MPVYSDESLEEENWAEGRAPHLRVEHVTEPSEEAMRKAAERGIAFVSQPIFEYCEIETYLRWTQTASTVFR